MRVLHVTECYDGGVRTVIDAFVQGIATADHGLLYRGTSRPAPGFEGRAARLPAGPATVAELRRYTAAWRPDVVHAHSSWAGLYARIAQLSAPVIYQPHCYAFEDTTRSAPLAAAFRLVERALAPATALTVAVSHHECGLARGLAATPVAFVPNASRLTPPPAMRRRRDEPTTVAMVGRLCPQKDPGFFRMARESAPSTIRWRWLGDGDHAYRADLESAGVEVTGWLEPAALAAELAAADVYLHTARWEGFPVTVLDAAVLGVPVVARRIPALDACRLDLVDTPREAADAVMRIARDDDARQAAIDAGQALLTTMNPTAQLDAMTQAYRTVAPWSS